MTSINKVYLHTYSPTYLQILLLQYRYYVIRRERYKEVILDSPFHYKLVKHNLAVPLFFMKISFYRDIHPATVLEVARTLQVFGTAVDRVSFKTRHALTFQDLWG